jgi:hypothetical protein
MPFGHLRTVRLISYQKTGFRDLGKGCRCNPPGALALAAEDRVVPWNEGLVSKTLALRATADRLGPSQSANKAG